MDLWARNGNSELWLSWIQLSIRGSTLFLNFVSASRPCFYVVRTNFCMSVRWDPKNPDPGFFLQSAGLFALYYSLQITIHRPFIPSPRKPSRIPFPSLAICTSAARSCVHVLDTVYRRSGPADILHQCTVCTAYSHGLLTMY